MPTFVGVITSLVSWPGNASCFCPNSGTQNEWITSFAVRCSSTERPTGRRSCAEVRFFWSGYENVHSNWRAVTSTFSWFEPGRSFWTRTMPLITEIAVTRIAGTAVQTISIPVCPWIGGPSESSSGRTRNFHTE